MSMHHLVGILVGPTLLIASAASAQSADAIDCVMSRPAPEITAMINGQGPYRFEIHFTDGPVRIKRDLYDELNLSESDSTIRTITLGDRTIRNLTAKSWDPSSMYSGDSAPDGFLTLSTFEGLLFTLDLANETVRVEPGELKAGGSSIDYVLRDFDDERRVLITARLGEKPLEIVLTANTQTTIHFSDAAIKELPLDGEPGLMGRVITDEGEAEITGARLTATLTAGGLTLERPGARFSSLFDTPTLGVPQLGDYAVTFDHTHRLVRFKKTEPATVTDSPIAGGDIGGLPELKTAFNEDKDKTRLVMILSPT